MGRMPYTFHLSVENLRKERKKDDAETKIKADNCLPGNSALVARLHEKRNAQKRSPRATMLRAETVPLMLILERESSTENFAAHLNLSLCLRGGAASALAGWRRSPPLSLVCVSHRRHLLWSRGRRSNLRRVEFGGRRVQFGSGR